MPKYEFRIPSDGTEGVPDEPSGLEVPAKEWPLLLKNYTKIITPKRSTNI